MYFEVLRDKTGVEKVKCYMSWQSCSSQDYEGTYFIGEVFSLWTFKLVHYIGHTEGEKLL